MKNETLQHRFDIVFLFDVVDGNPNGDPDDDNRPRSDDETGHGLVTDVCIKRKIRDAMMLLSTSQGSAMFITGEDAANEDRVLNLKMKKAYEEKNLKPGDAEAIGIAKQFMCETYRDVRTFGAVMSTGTSDGDSDNRHNAGKVTGPVQLGALARTVDPVCIMEHCITRKCLASEKEAKEQIKKNNMITGTMGRKSTVAYGLYRQMAWVSPGLAAKSGFTRDDLKVFLKALAICFQNDRSAARGHMSFRGAYVFEHDSSLGSGVNDFELFDRIKITKTTESPRSFGDYKVEVDRTELPKGIKLHEITNADQVDKVI